MPHRLGSWQERLDAAGSPEHLDIMWRDRNPPGLDNKSALDKKSKRKAREEKLAASLRENLVRRKAQARARRRGEARDSEAAVKEVEVDLEVKGIDPDIVPDTVPDAISDTGAVPEADR